MPTKKATKAKKLKARQRAKRLGLNRGDAKAKPVDFLPMEEKTYREKYFRAIYGRDPATPSGAALSLERDPNVDRAALRDAAERRERRGATHVESDDLRFGQKPLRYQRAVRDLQQRIAAKDAAIAAAVPDVATSLDTSEVPRADHSVEV